MQVKIGQKVLEISFAYLLLMIVLLFLLYSIYQLSKKEKLSSRLEKYVVKSKKEEKVFMNLIEDNYLGFISFISWLLLKMKIFNFLALKYQKYLNTINFKYQNAIDFVSEKIFLLILLIVINFLFKTNSFYLLMIFVVIVLVIESVNAFKYKQYLAKLNHQFETAITIMNNAFYAGRSILQAIETVAKKSKGFLADEFQKIFDEVNIGLSVEEAFLRFAKRVNLKDAQYLAVTIGILAKSGGEINQLFVQFQKRIFHQKTIMMEIEAVTGGLKIMTGFLMAMPFVIIILIYSLNSDYFRPLLFDPLGNLIIGVCSIIYIVYLIVVRKIFAVGS